MFQLGGNLHACPFILYRVFGASDLTLQQEKSLCTQTCICTQKPGKSKLKKFQILCIEGLTSASSSRCSTKWFSKYRYMYNDYNIKNSNLQISIIIIMIYSMARFSSLQPVRIWCTHIRRVTRKRVCYDLARSIMDLSCEELRKLFYLLLYPTIIAN